MNSTIWRLQQKRLEITSLMKDNTTLSNEIEYSLHNAGFIDIAKSLMTDDGYFNFVYLSMLLDFCKDCRHVIINARHELILN